MQEEPTKVVTELFRRADDLDRMATLWDSQARVTPAPGWPEPGPFVGREAIIQQFERLFADWSENRFEEIEVAADSGDWVIATWVWVARGAASELEMRSNLAATFRVQNGKVAEAHFGWNREEALEAAGLSH